LTKVNQKLGLGLSLIAVMATSAAAVLAEPAPPTAPVPGKKAIDWVAARNFWAFQRPKPHSPPAVRNGKWPRQPVDYFVLGRLEKAGVAPAPEQDRRPLIRRLSYDLTGLPPDPEFVERFASDSAPDAYQQAVERLLAAPQFGERMASFWLPLARFAEDQAHQVGSDTRFFYPNAHLYREWVSQAFNRDLPYDRFLRYQIAADLSKDAEKSDLAALGFLGLGPKYYNRNRLDVMTDEWQDRVDTLTRATLGLTVACARCHDHKYDPITMQDYYALAGVFASTKMVNRSVSGGVVPPTVEAAKMPKDTVHVLEEDTPRDVNLFLRGNVDNKGPVVHRRFLRVFSENEPEPFKQGSGRLELAEAIAAPSNPLTSRVFVNRVWGLVFGRPLVGTQSNFGSIGDKPTHPELLDDLAIRFEKGGWSTKGLVRELVLSAAYRQRPDAPGSAGSDPTNELLGRMNRRRLTVEQWRDTVLKVAGTLEGGEGPSQDLDDPRNHRRTLFARISRLKLNDLLAQFDYPDANVHAEKRSNTNTPIQKLYLLNSPFILEQARQFASRVASDAPEGDGARIRRAYMLLYARQPDPVELRLGLEFLARPETGERSRWDRYAQMLLASNELLYVD
jgi:hypothetical protein